jgi:hypothetical protein
MLSNENRTLVIPIYNFELAPMMDITAMLAQAKKKKKIWDIIMKSEI